MHVWGNGGMHVCLVHASIISRHASRPATCSQKLSRRWQNSMSEEFAEV